tara:strand:- start:640 stop:1185 length:546 start_codon:yes stop_codon:yes gene_type:complete
MTFNKTIVTINGKSGIFYCEPHMVKLPSHAETQREDWETEAFPIWVDDQGRYETMIERSGYFSYDLEEIERLLRIFMLNEGYAEDDFPHDMAKTFTYPIYVEDLNDANLIANVTDDDEIYDIIDRVLSGSHPQHELARDPWHDYGVIRIHSATDKCNAMKAALEIVDTLNCANYTAKMNEI